MTNKLPSIAILDSAQYPYLHSSELEQETLHGRAQLHLFHVSSVDDVIKIAPHHNVYINWHRVALPSEVFPHMTQCQGIVRAAVGFDNIDLKAAQEYGIKIAHVPDYGTEEVADHTMALLLSLARGVKGGINEVASGGWQWNYGERRFRLRGKRLGILGLGRIGTAVARRSIAFGLDVSFFDPYLKSGVEKAHGIKRFHSLELLLEHSDILSIHLPLTAETRGMIGKDELSRLPTDAVLINTSRGEVVQGKALKEALDNGSLAAAGLDVVEGEPEIPHWVRTHEKILLSPHSAFFSPEAMIELRTRTVEIAVQFLLGRRPIETIV